MIGTIDNLAGPEVELPAAGLPVALQDHLRALLSRPWTPASRRQLGRCLRNLRARGVEIDVAGDVLHVGGAAFRLPGPRPPGAVEVVA